MAAKDFPTLKLECAFGSNPGAESPTWTDITPYIRYQGGFSCKRGRQTWLGKSSAGSAAVELDNLDRRFDPDYATSPYAPNVITTRKLRMLASKYPELLLLDTPAGYWRLNEASGNALDLSGNANHATITGTGITRSAVGLLGGDRDACYQLDTAGSFAIDAGNPASLQFNNLLWLECIITPDVIQQQGIMGRWGGGANGLCYQLVMWADGSLSLRTSDDGINIYNCQTAAGVCTIGQRYHIVAWKTGVWGSIYVNGVQVALTPFAPVLVWAGDATSNFYLGSCATWDRFDGKIDEVFVKGGAVPTGTQIADHYAEGNGRGIFTVFVDAWPPVWPGNVDAVVNVSGTDGYKALGIANISKSYSAERSDVRIGHVADDAGWPAADRNFQAGQTTVIASVLSKEAALSHMQKVVEAENGNLFIDGLGRLTFHDRHYRVVEQGTSLALFGDGGGSELPYFDLETANDESELWNDVSVTRSGGTEQTASDAPSQAAHFKRSLSALTGVLVAGDTEALNMAQWLLANGISTKTRLTALVLRPQRSDALWTQVLRREIGDRITVRRRPPGGGAYLEWQAHIEQISHKVTGSEWETRWQLSNADQTLYGVLDDGLNSQLDGGARLGY